MKTKEKKGIKNLVIIAAVLIALLFGSVFAATSSLSGYQSITANWNKVVWENAQTGTNTFTKQLSGTTFTWNPDATGIETNGLIPDGTDDLSTINGEVENPKWDRNIKYNDWWINDTVSEANPTGTASHYEWTIDIYKMNVNFRAVQGLAYFINPPKISVELQNNFDSVFNLLGADFAASYIIYAQTDDYNWTPESAGWHIISPTVGDFELFFLDGSQVTPPSYMEYGSKLNFDELQKYSHIEIFFELTEFGVARFGSEPVVNMEVALNVLTVGQFDYFLTYESGGTNDIAPVGALGVYDSIAMALAAGYNALMDGFNEIAASLIVLLIVIVLLIIIFIIIIKIIMMMLRKGSGKIIKKGKKKK